MSAVMKSTTRSSGTGAVPTKYREPKSPASSRSNPMNIELRSGVSGDGAIVAGNFEHHGDARGIVVGPGIEPAVRQLPDDRSAPHDDPFVFSAGIGQPSSLAPTFCPITVPGSLPGTACRKSPSKSGSSLSERN